MTEEIIINEKSLQAVLKRYDELEQENEILKAENRLLYKELREIRDRLTEVLDDEI